jgi:hypothetical protein
VAGKEAQVKQSISLINENEKPTPISGAKEGGRKGFSLTGSGKSPTTSGAEEANSRKRKANQKRVQRKNQKKKMKIKLRMKRMRTNMETELKEDRDENNKLQFESSQGSEPHSSNQTRRTRRESMQLYK